MSSSASLRSQQQKSVSQRSPTAKEQQEEQLYYAQLHAAQQQAMTSASSSSSASSSDAGGGGSGEATTKKISDRERKEREWSERNTNLIVSNGMPSRPIESIHRMHSPSLPSPLFSSGQLRAAEHEPRRGACPVRFHGRSGVVQTDPRQSHRSVDFKIQRQIGFTTDWLTDHCFQSPFIVYYYLLLCFLPHFLFRFLSMFMSLVLLLEAQKINVFLAFC